MEKVILEDIPWEVEEGKLLRKLHLEEESEDAQRVRELLREAKKVSSPRGMYRVAYIDKKGENKITIEGITFCSKVLRTNLEDVYRVFPFVATSGRELEEWSSRFEDMLEAFWAAEIKEWALRQAISHLLEDLKEKFHLEKVAAMNPGSLPDWPMEEQRKLFALLGDPVKEVGVELTESCLMIPVKSVSGIWFPAKIDFENCQLCSRENCPGRRAPYDENLARKYQVRV